MIVLLLLCIYIYIQGARKSQPLLIYQLIVLLLLLLSPSSSSTLQILKWHFAESVVIYQRDGKWVSTSWLSNNTNGDGRSSAYSRLQADSRSSLQLGLRVGGHLVLTDYSPDNTKWTLTYGWRRIDSTITVILGNISIKTKDNVMQLGKVSVIRLSVQKAMSSGGSRKTEVVTHPWRLVGDCSKHVKLPQEMHGHRTKTCQWGWICCPVWMSKKCCSVNIVMLNIQCMIWIRECLKWTLTLE